MYIFAVVRLDALDKSEYRCCSRCPFLAWPHAVLPCKKNTNNNFPYQIPHCCLITNSCQDAWHRNRETSVLAIRAPVPAEPLDSSLENHIYWRESDRITASLVTSANRATGSVLWWWTIASVPKTLPSELAGKPGSKYGSCFAPKSSLWYIFSYPWMVAHLDGIQVVNVPRWYYRYRVRQLPNMRTPLLPCGT